MAKENLKLQKVNAIKIGECLYQLYINLEFRALKVLKRNLLEPSTWVRRTVMESK